MATSYERDELEMKILKYKQFLRENAFDDVTVGRIEQHIAELEDQIRDSKDR